jgi:hypothetical protein
MNTYLVFPHQGQLSIPLKAVVKNRKVSRMEIQHAMIKEMSPKAD